MKNNNKKNREDVEKDDVNTLIDLSSPFFDLEYERSKIRGLRL